MVDPKTEDCPQPGKPVTDYGWWRIHALLVEAATWLIIAKLLVAFVRFGRWRGWLGRLVPAGEPGRARTDRQAPGQHDRYLSRVVDRAASRLPFECLCLPQAMALQWMLARRGRRPTLLIGALPGHKRGKIDSLHAWVELGGEVLIGGSSETYAILARLQS